MSGWIRISRAITEMQGYLGEKFNRTMCWIDLILLAEREPKEIIIRGIKTVVGRGQIAISVRELGERWTLSHTIVKKRLKDFTSAGLINVESSNVVNIITIIDYEIYQSKDIEVQRDLFGNIPPSPPQKRQTKPPIQKHKYAPEVLLTEEEYGKLVDGYGEAAAKWMIQKLDDYKAARGTTYKSDYRAILNWVVKEWQKQQGYGNNKPGNENRRGSLEVTATGEKDYSTTF